MNDNNKRPREEENDNIASAVSFENEDTMDAEVTMGDIMDLFGLKSPAELKKLKEIIPAVEKLKEIIPAVEKLKEIIPIIPKIQEVFGEKSPAELKKLTEVIPIIPKIQEEVATLRGRLDNIVGALKPATTHALLESAVYMSVDGFDDNAKYGAAQQCSLILEALISNEKRPLIDPNTNSMKSWVAPGIRRLAAKDRLPMMVQALDGLSTFVAEVDAETLGAWDSKKQNALVHNGQLCNALHETPSKVDNRGHGHDHDHLEEKNNVKKLLAKFKAEGRKSHKVSELRQLVNVEEGKEEEDITNFKTLVRVRISAVAKAIREKKEESLDDDVVNTAIEFVLHLRYE